MVTYVSLRLAMKHIVLTVCGVLCEEVVVVSPRQFEPRMYLVQVPSELRPDVYLHIAEKADIPIPLWSDALYLSVADAEKLQEYSETLPEMRFDYSLQSFEKELKHDVTSTVQELR